MTSLYKSHNAFILIYASPLEIASWSTTSPVATEGGFGGLRPPNKAPSPPKLKYATLEIGGVFIKFSECQAPLHKHKAPY